MPQLAGEDILASDINIPKYISKAASQSVTSSTVYVNDNDFSFTLPVGTYRIELVASATAVAPVGTADIKMKWVNTGTMSLIGRATLGSGTAATSVTTATVRIQQLNLGTDAAYGLNASNWIIREDLLIDVTVSGVLTLQWAQNASNATPTTLNSTSRVYITLLEAF